MTKSERAGVSRTGPLVVNTLDKRASTVNTVLLPVSDPRGAKAVAIATNAGQWLRCKTRDGRKAYGIKGSNDVYHLTTRSSCTCKDFAFGRGRDCKHVLAVELHCRLMAEQAA